MQPLPVTLAFFNVGPTEVVVILVLYFVLFGAEKLPAFARELGRLSARWNLTKREITASLLTEDERKLTEQTRFERMRELQMAQQSSPTAATHDEEPVSREADAGSRTK